MKFDTAILLVILIVSLGASLYWLLKKWLNNLNERNQSIFNQTLASLQRELIETFKNLNQINVGSLQATLEENRKIVESMSKLEEMARKLETSSQEIKTFKEIFIGPKNRGILGEIMLEEILRALPSSAYERQYQLGSWRVDYVLKVNDSLIPIDAKFPVKNFYRLFEVEGQNKQLVERELIKNLKNKIDEIAQKYIFPSQGTIEFALMYLANESVYYELLSNPVFVEVWDYAREKSVVITSPKTFEFVTSAVALVIRKQELSRNIHQVLVNLRQLEKDILECKRHFEVAYKQLKDSFNNFQTLERSLNKVYNDYRDLIKSETSLIKLEKKSEENLFLGSKSDE